MCKGQSRPRPLGPPSIYCFFHTPHLQEMLLALALVYIHMPIIPPNSSAVSIHYPYWPQLPESSHTRLHNRLNDLFKPKSYYNQTSAQKPLVALHLTHREIPYLTRPTGCAPSGMEFILSPHWLFHSFLTVLCFLMLPRAAWGKAFALAVPCRERSFPVTSWLLPSIISSDLGSDSTHQTGLHWWASKRGPWHHSVLLFWFISFLTLITAWTIFICPPLSH